MKTYRFFYEMLLVALLAIPLNQVFAVPVPDPVSNGFTQEGSVGSYTTGIQLLDGSYSTAPNNVNFGYSGASNITAMNISGLTQPTGITLKIKNKSTGWLTATNGGYTNANWNYASGSFAGGFVLDYAVEVDWDQLTAGNHVLTFTTDYAMGPPTNAYFGAAFTITITAVADGAGTAPAVVKPTISTGNASVNSATSATISGSCSNNGGGALTAYGITVNGTDYNGLGSVTSWTATASGLNPNTSYNYSAFGTNSAGRSDGSSSSFTTPPASPSASAYSSASTTSITANWSAPSGGASGYYLDFGSVLSGTNVGNLTSYQVNNLTPGTAYSYRVRAYGTGGTSDYSNAITAYTHSTEPNAHAQTFTATPASTTSMTVNFAAIQNRISNCAGYILLRKQGATAPNAEGAVDGAAYSAPNGTTLVTTIYNLATTSYLDQNLTAETQYTYALIPFNWDGTNAGPINYRTLATIPTISQYTHSLEPVAHSNVFNVDVQAARTFRIYFQALQNITNCDGYYIVRRTDQQSLTTNFNDGSAYTAPSGTEIVGHITDPTATYWDNTIELSTTYYYSIIPYNWDGTHTATYNYKTDVAPNINFRIDPPSLQTSNLRFANVTRNSITLIWDNGNGNKRAIFVKGSRLSTTPVTDGTIYESSPIFGRGTMIDRGAYCVYNGTGTNVIITNLDRYMLYYFRAFEYNEPISSVPAGVPIYTQVTNSNNPVSRFTLRKEAEEFGEFTESQIEIYPNPAKDVLNYSISIPEVSNVSVELIDASGRIVKSFNHGILQVGNQTLQSNISDIADGVYLLSIKIGEEQLIGIVDVVK